MPWLCNGVRTPVLGNARQAWQERRATLRSAAVRGFALAGVLVLPAVTAEEVRRAWAAVPAGTAVILLTRTASEALGAVAAAPHGPLIAVIPIQSRPTEEPG